MRTLRRIPDGSALALVLALGLLVPAAPSVAEEGSREGGPAQGARTVQETRTIRVKILGMSCPFCAYGAEQKLRRLDGFEELEVELQSGIATLVIEDGADLSNERLRKTVDDAGFEAAAIVRSFESEFEDVNPEGIPGGGDPGTGGP